MSPVVILLFLVEVTALMTSNSQTLGFKPKVKKPVNNSEDLGGKTLHSYMKQLYNTRAQGNGNGSFTIFLRNQKILATTIRGFGVEKNGKNS